MKIFTIKRVLAKRKVLISVKVNAKFIGPFVISAYFIKFFAEFIYINI